MAQNHGHHHHIIPFKTYMAVFLTLIFLTVVTVGVARPVTGVDLGVLSTFIAMLIATVKASFVLLYFMHLKYDDKLNAVVLASGFFFLVLMFLLSWIDIATRVLQESTL